MVNSPAVHKNLSVADLKTRPTGWISLEAPTKAEIKAINEMFDLKEGNLDDALDIYESPRLDHDTDYSYLYIRWPQVKNGVTSTHPLLMIYNEKELITASPAKLELDDYLFSSESGLSTRSPKNILLALLEQSFYEYEIYIKGQSESVRKMITKMRQRKLESEDFIRFVLVEEQISGFLSALEPIAPLLRRLSTTKHFILTTKDRDAIEDVILLVEQLIHLCHTNVARIVSVREAYAALSNNSLNRTMKALTAATFFIALPNVVFGMYGMNIDLPIQHSSLAFITVVSSTLVAVLLIIFIAKRRRWF